MSLTTNEIAIETLVSISNDYSAVAEIYVNVLYYMTFVNIYNFLWNWHATKSKVY